MMRRIVALITAAVFIIGTSLLSANAVTAEFAEEPGFQKLIGLKILPDGFAAQGNMTRGEFAKILAALYQNENVIESETAFFNDLGEVKDKGTVQAVNFLASRGVLKGYPDADFRAGDSLEREEAAVALIRILGYEYVAETEGGYPSGYSQTALKIGLLSGLKGNEPVNTALAVMLDNALDIKVLERGKWGGELELNRGEKTLMQTLLKLEKLCGLVYSVGNMALSEEYCVKENYAAIGNNIFKAACNIKTVQKLIGYTGNAYYREENGEYVLYYLQDTKRERTLTVELGRDTALSGETLTYYDKNGKMKTVMLDAAPYVIYNGRPTDKIPALGNNGSITCIQGESGKYDRLIIEDYKTYVVDKVFDEGYGIVSKYTAKDLPYLTEPDEVCLVDKNGSDMKISEIAENDVLSVMQSLDGKFISMRLSRGGFLGKLDAISGDSYDDYRLRISGIEYRVTPEFYEYLTEWNETSLLLLVDNFYKDVFGRVAHVDVPSSFRRNTLGYLTGVAKRNGFQQPKIKVFTQDGVFEELSLSEKMEFDEYGRKVDSLAACDWFAENIKSGQVIYYKKNRDNEVTFIQTAASQERDGLWQMSSVTEKRWRTNQKCFGSKAMIRDDTVIFVVPMEPKDFSNESYYRIGSLSTFANSKKYSVIPYSLQKDAYTADALVYPADFKGTLMDSVLLADDVVQNLNNNGVMVDRLYAWNISGALTSFNAKEDVDLKQTNLPFAGSLPDGEIIPLSKGDIIRYAGTPDNEIGSYYMIYSYETDTYYSNTNPYLKTDGEEYRFGMGKVLGIEGTNLKVQYRNSNEIEYFNVEKTNVVIVSGHGDRTKIRTGSIAELKREDISNVFIYAPSNNPTIIYAYED